MTQVRNENTGSVYDIDESKCVHDMERACPRFFKTKHGKRETFSDYRGCLIVRHTVQYTGSRPQRETVVYAFCELEGRMDLFCVSIGSRCNSIAQAKRLIDDLLDNGVYSYGFHQ